MARTLEQAGETPQTREQRPGTSAHLDVNAFLLEVADVVNTSLDLDTVLRRVAEMVRRVINYEIFAILLLNEKAQTLRIRFQVGHPPDVAERIRIRLGEGVTGQAALRREAVLVNDVTRVANYIGSGAEVRSELAVPLILKNRVIGVIDIEAPQPNQFTEEHKNLLALVASRLAIGIENARLYGRVSKQAKSLSLLNEISRELTSILNLDELLNRIADRVAQLIDYQMFSVLLIDETGERLQHRFSVRFGESAHIKHDIPMNAGLVGYSASHREPLLVGDVKRDPRYIEANPETRSELVVPLLYKGKAIGVLDLEHTRRGFFTEDHMRTMSTLAAQIAIAIENARLYERIAKEEKRLERDLAMARELQFHLLPKSVPVLPNAELAARFLPARAIGGDLYDWVHYSGDRLGLTIGDVSGKGAPAALFAALVSGFVRSHAVQEPGVAEMLKQVNSSLIARPIDAQFVSLVYAVWDDKARTMEVANSGLPRPIYYRDGNVERIEATGLPVGLFPDAEYDAVRIEARANDVFVFFSDGLIDARNMPGELFGRERIEKIVGENAEKSAEDLVEILFAAVGTHAAGVEAFDDQTVVAFKVK
jgi:sigma-B regulation protein RsbU (phosphoserine phosphatase)